jgi:hypothetical protein
MNLIELVTTFRSAIERLGQHSFNHTSLAVTKFPGGCCDDASILLARYLEENGYESVNLIHGSNGGEDNELNSHDWLMVGDNIVDITADQFDWKGYINPPIIIEKTTVFHATFKHLNKGRALDTERATDHHSGFISAYNLIKSEIIA